MGGTPITLVSSGGIPITNTAYRGPAFTPVASGGLPATLVTSGGMPVTLVNQDGSLWVDGVVTPLSISGTPGPATIGLPYSYTAASSGGTAPYTFALSPAAGFSEVVLQPGLSPSSNGVTGTPVVG